MLKNRNKLLYKSSYAFFDIEGYFASDLKIRAFTRQEAESMDDLVINPDVNEEGLKRRVSIVTMIGGMFYVLATVLIAVVMIPLILFNALTSTIIFSGTIVFYLLGTAIFISLRRGCLASLDLIRYRRSSHYTPSSREGTARKQFKINRHAAPQIHDLFPGVVVAILAAIIMIS